MPRDKLFETNTELTSAVFDLINKQGKEILTIRTLSKALNISSMTLYNYISDIQELRASVVAQGHALMTNQVNKARNTMTESATLEIRLHVIGMALFDFVSKNTEIFHLMVTSDKICSDKDSTLPVQHEHISSFLNFKLDETDAKRVNIVNDVLVFNLLKMSRDNNFQRDSFKDCLEQTFELLFHK